VRDSYYSREPASANSICRTVTELLHYPNAELIM
jgi:hypothetical protein